MTVTLTPELLADLRKKAEAATPGPWLPRCDYRWDLRWFANDKNHASVATADGAELVDREICRFQTDGSPGDVDQVRADIEHVAAANPAVVLALLDRIEALRGKVSEWQLATRCGSPVDAALLRRVAMEVAANMCTNIEDARRIRASAAETLAP